MFPWFGLDKLLFWLLRVFLNWSTNAKALSTDLAELGLDPAKPVYYILQNRSAADAVVINKEVIKLGLPPLLEPFHLGTLHAKRRYFSLYRGSFFSSRQRRTASFTPLRALIAEMAADSQLEIQLLPVSIFWGRRPDKENSLWKVVFSDSWTPAGFIKKFLIVLTQGKQLFVQFSPVMSLRQLVDETPNQEKVLRKASRILRVHFRRQREATIGPDLSHRRMLLDSLVNSPTVRQSIEAYAQEHSVTLKKAEEKAKKYAHELAADYSHTVIRFLEIVLNWVWHRLFDGIKLYNLDRIRSVARDHEIIYVPCHRSHLDYLLMSFVLYRNGLVPPHIAAGINLNMPVVGTILRRGGAFFMRRTFKDNPLYTAVFNEYLHIMLTRGFPVEYFVEGGRSRSGRMLPAKTGMLVMTTQSFIRDSRKPIALVPVYVGYEKVIEAGSYIGEMYGKKKKKESIGGLFSSLGILRKNWGQVHANIGKPILLGEFLDQQHPDWQTGDSETWLRPVIKKLGNEVTRQINAAAVANPINLLSLALLATDKHTIDEQLLRCQLNLYITLLQKAPYSDSVEIAQTDPQAIIDYAIEHEFAFRIEHPQGNLISTEPATALEMTYIRNNTLHLFALPGLISSFFLHARTLKRERLHQLIQLLYPFLQSEYSLHWQAGDELTQAADTIIDVMVDKQLLIEENQSLGGAAVHTVAADQLFHLGKTVLQMQERLLLTIRILVEHGTGKLDAAALQDIAQQTAHRFSLLHEFNSPDFFDKTVFKTLVEELLAHKLVTVDDANKLHFDQRLMALNEESTYLLNADTRMMLQRLARRSGDSAAADAPQNKPTT